MIALLAFVLAAPPTATAESRPVPDAVAEPVRKLLDDKAVDVKDGDAELMAFWFRKAIPAKATAEQVKNGLTYRECVETTVVGVVTFAKPFTDYRKQEIPAGTYTLRFVFQPDTGDHKDTAPHTEFLLLCPVADDTTAEEREVKDVVTMSKKATGGDHPGVMLLVPAKADADGLTVETKDGVTVVKVMRTVEVNGGTAALGFGVTVAGVSKTR
jgi:hypothetical protein